MLSIIYLYINKKAENISVPRFYELQLDGSLNCSSISH